MTAPLLRAEARWIQELEHGAPRAQAHAALCLAELARVAGRHDRAQRLLRLVAHDGDPVFAPRAAFELGDLLENDLGRPYGAERWFVHAADLSRPELTPDVHNNLAARLATAAQYQQAIALYREVVQAADAHGGEELREEAAVAGYRLGDLLAEQGRREEAEAAWRVVLASGVDEAVVHAALALAQLLADDQRGLDDACALLEAVIGADHPDCSPLAALRLAELCERADNCARALDLYELVVACGHPDYAPSATEALRLLRERQIEVYLTSVLDRGLPPELGAPRDFKPDLCLRRRDRLLLVQPKVERVDYRLLPHSGAEPPRAAAGKTETVAYLAAVAAFLKHPAFRRPSMTADCWRRGLRIYNGCFASEQRITSTGSVRSYDATSSALEAQLSEMLVEDDLRGALRRPADARSTRRCDAGIVLPGVAGASVVDSLSRIRTAGEDRRALSLLCARIPERLIVVEDEAPDAEWDPMGLLAVLLAWTARRRGEGRDGWRWAARDVTSWHYIVDLLVTTARDARAQQSPATEPAIRFLR